MIGIAIKYFIVDLCITSLFGSVSDKFDVNGTVNKPKVGDRYRKVIHNYTTETYYGCTVTEIGKLLDGNGIDTGETMIYIEFDEVRFDDEVNYDDFDGDSPMDDDEISSFMADIEGFDDGDDQIDDLAYNPNEYDDVDYTEIDLVTTVNKNVVGLNQNYFTFYK